MNRRGTGNNIQHKAHQQIPNLL